MVNKAYVHTPHDKGYKRDLSIPAEFLHFLQKYVKEDWTKDLTVSQLRLCDKEFIDKDYEGREADLIYEVIRPNRKRVFLFVLQELQSTVDYTMIFRVLVYVFNHLLRFFLSAPKEEREAKNFRLPAMIPIVFYNGTENWSAVQRLREYQYDGEKFGSYILDLKYYLIDLAHIEEEYILSTNTLIDNIMYCDKLRKKNDLIEALKKAYERIGELDGQSQKEFDSWVKYILLSVCGNKKAVMEEVLNRNGNGDEDMAFKYNIIKAFENEREEGKAEIIIGAVRNMIAKKLDLMEIAELLGQAVEYIEKVMVLIENNPEANDGEIAKLLTETQEKE